MSPIFSNSNPILVVMSWPTEPINQITDLNRIEIETNTSSPLPERTNDGAMGLQSYL